MKTPFFDHLNHLLIVLIFSAAVFIPFFTGVVQKDNTISAVEKRPLAIPPKAPKNIRDIKEFPAKFEAYYADHFGFRDGFNAYYKLAKYYLGDSPSLDVTIGKNGWLFLGSIKKGYAKYSDPIGDFRGANLFTQQQLEEFAAYLTGLETWLNDQGIAYVFIIAPNKHTIYCDQLPDYILKAKLDSVTAMDQLVSYLRKNTGITIIDPRTILLNEKANCQLYFKTDTHWTAYAANLVQYSVFTEIDKLFPGTVQPELYSITTKGKRNGDLANFIGISTLKESNPKPLFKQFYQPIRHPPDAKKRETHTFTCENQKLNAVIFRDSFFTALQPFFARQFYRSTYVWERVSYPSLVKYIEAENPNIIIEEWVERSLPYVPKSRLASNRAP